MIRHIEKKEKKTNIKMEVYIHFMQTNEIKSGVCQFGINTQQSNFIYHQPYDRYDRQQQKTCSIFH